MVDNGTNVTFYLHDTHCKGEVPQNHYYWHAGRTLISHTNSDRDGQNDLFDLFSASSNFTDDNEGNCNHIINLMVTIVVNWLQPPNNVIHFKENNSARVICSPGYSLAEYFVLLIRDSDTCLFNGTSCCVESSNTISGLSNGVKTLTPSPMSALKL